MHGSEESDKYLHSFLDFAMILKLLQKQSLLGQCYSVDGNTIICNASILYEQQFEIQLILFSSSSLLIYLGWQQRMAQGFWLQHPLRRS